MKARNKTNQELIQEFSKVRKQLESVIEDHWKTENSLKKSEIRFRHIIEKNADGIILLKLDGDILFANPAAERLFGRSADELVGTKFGFPLVKNKPAELNIIRGDGKITFAEMRIVKMTWDDKDAFLASLRDISERKQAALAFKKSEERYFSLLESNPDPIVVYDNEGKVVYFNAAFTRVFGWELDECLGKKMDVFVPRENWPETQMMIDKIKAGENFSGMESRRYTKSGDMIAVSISGAVHRTKDSTSNGSIVNLRDITEQKRLEAQLQQSQKMEAIGVLAGGVAHDFNNILTIINANARIALMMNADLEESVRENLEDIELAGERGAALTRQLLAFSRKQIIKPTITHLNGILANMKKMLACLIGEDVEIQIFPGNALWKIVIDAGQIEQIIMNLAVNAKDAMPKGGKLTIKTANRDLDENFFVEHEVQGEPGPYVMLGVSDTGTGMDQETQKRIFEPFYTSKEEGRGTGLGLSTVYGIVKQNNGFIWVYSEPGRGSIFEIYLPKAKDEVEEAKDQKEQTDMGQSGFETVLIVEDDARLRKILRKILKQKGYKLLEAENGEDALRKSREHHGRIDLMLTDVIMPKMNGKATAERIKSLHPRIKIIYMSGYTDDFIVHHGVLTPELNFLQKPFSPKTLTRKVRKVLDQ